MDKIDEKYLKETLKEAIDLVEDEGDLFFLSGFLNGVIRRQSEERSRKCQENRKKTS